MANDKDCAHKNHRERLKRKVRGNGLKCLEYHEVLELLLTYTIPRKDTNPIAHSLINRFGSFSATIDADYHDLLKVDGIGPESALFLNVLSQMKDVYLKSKQEQENIEIKTTMEAVKFFRKFYPIKDKEFMVMVCLNKAKRLIRVFRYVGQSENEVTFDIKQITNNINDNGVNSVVLFHTHPQGVAMPSMSDIVSTQKLVNVCLMNGIDFDDHIILTESNHYSFNTSKAIDVMKNKYVTVFGAGFVDPNILKTIIKNDDIED